MQQYLFQIPKRKEVQEEPYQLPALPKEFANQDGINIAKGIQNSNHENVFLNINQILSAENDRNRSKLISYALNSITSETFYQFFDSQLFENILKNYYKLLDDNVTHQFLVRNITDICKRYETSSYNILEKTLSSSTFRKSRLVLAFIFYTKVLVSWVQHEPKDENELKVILKATLPLESNLNTIPTQLLSEIARCCLSIVFLLPNLKFIDAQEYIFEISNILLRILKYAPKAFQNPAIVYLLNNIQNNELPTSSITRLRLMGKPASIASTIFLIKASLNLLNINSKDQLIDAMGFMNSLNYISLSEKQNVLQSGKELEEFFIQTSDPVDVKPAFIDKVNFSDVPTDLNSLAFFFTQPNKNYKIFQKAVSTNLGTILKTIFETVKSLQMPTADLDTLTSCATILSSLCSLEPPSNLGDTPLITPHFVHIAVLIFNAALSSPLYPHTDSSFLLEPCIRLFTVIKDLGFSMSKHLPVVVDYLFSLSVTPGGVKLLEYAIANIKDTVPVTNFMKIRANIIVNYILKLLSIPSNIGTEITASAYITTISYYLRTKLPQKEIFPLLMAPLSIITSLSSTILKETTNMNRGNFIIALRFIELILEYAPCKTFCIINAPSEFWNNLMKLLELTHIGTAKITIEIIKILTKLADYGNTIATEIIGLQRLVFDVMYVKNLIRFLKLIDNIQQERLLLVDSINFSEAVLMLLLALSDPFPVCKLASLCISTKKLFTWHDLGMKGSAFNRINVQAIIPVLVQEFENARKEDDPDPGIQDVQDMFASPETSPYLSQLYCKLLNIPE